MISWPYTKLMNSNNMVDQGAVLILTSAEKADVSPDSVGPMGFPVCGNRCPRHLCDRRARRVLHRHPRSGSPGARALELAGAGIDDIEFVDVYSCFPSAVQVAANELGLPIGDPGRPLTVTGGLTFAGGPWNNYVTPLDRHDGRTAGGQPGTARPDHRQRWLPDQTQLRRVRHRATGTRIPLGGRATRSRPGADADSTGGVERRGHGRVVDDARRPGRQAREGVPGGADLPDAAARVLAVITDAADAEATVAGDIAGAAVHVHADGTASLK